MFNRPRKSKHPKDIITKIYFTLIKVDYPKPYEISATGHFCTDSGACSFDCTLYVSQISINNTVTVFGNIQLNTPLTFGSPEISAQSLRTGINFDFPMNKNLRDIPHAIVYGVLQHGTLDEECVIDFQTELLERLWEMVDKEDA